MKTIKNIKIKIAALVCGITLLCGTAFHTNAAPTLVTIGNCTYFAWVNTPCGCAVWGVACGNDRDLVSVLVYDGLLDCVC